MTALETFGPWVFFRSLLRDPLSVGAVVPSSPRLSRLVASSVGEGDSLVVEVGAGTGSITEALLDRGVRPERLLLIERDAFLAAYLQDRFPRVQVRCGDALHASSMLENEHVGRVQTLLSSLPIRNFKPAEQIALINAMMKTLAPTGQLIQYTYAPYCPIPSVELGLKAECLGRVWMNLPPAAVWRFTRMKKVRVSGRRK
jgi:phosphatidylethanolamine/phosphatidyl-N-methylethanolamine N-methyltransferase